MVDERKYTHEEWVQKTKDEMLIGKFRVAGTGSRIKSIDVLRRILAEAIWPILDSSIMKDAEKLFDELGGYRK